MSEDSTAERLNADLESGDPRRVAAAVLDLDLRWQKLQDVAVPAPSADVLDVLDRANSEAVAVAYLKALVFYDFTPPVDAHDRANWAVQALLRHGGSRFATELALMIADEDSFGAGVAQVLRLIERTGPIDERGRTATGWLASSLLDLPQLRRATIDVLAGWSARPELAPVVDFVRPQLVPDELARIGPGSAT